MPIYKIAAPDGYTYDVEGPDDARDEDLIRAVYAQYPESATPPAQNKSAMGDALTALKQGAVGSVKALTDIAGADNVVSRKLEGVSSRLQREYSPAAQEEMRQQAERMRAAEATGSTWEEIKAGARNIAEAPLRSAAQGVGSFAPYLPAMLAAPAGAAIGLSTRAVSALTAIANTAPKVMGTAQGVGAVKGAIYDAVYKAELEATRDEAAAKAKAEQAQAYFGDNWGQIAAGGGLGFIAGSSGVEKLLTPAGRAGAPTALLPRAGRAVASEFATEAPQGGQERLAANIALQRAGYDVPTFQGVAGQATTEGLTGALSAGPVAALRGPEKPAPAPAPKLQEDRGAPAPTPAEPEPTPEPTPLPDTYPELIRMREALRQQAQTDEAKAQLQEIETKISDIHRAALERPMEEQRIAKAGEAAAKEAGFPARESAKVLAGEEPAQVELREALPSPELAQVQPRTELFEEGEKPLTRKEYLAQRKEQEAAGQMTLDEAIPEPVLRKKPVPPTPQELPTTLDDAALSALGIAPRALMRRPGAGLLGSDITDPAQAKQVKELLEHYQEITKSDKTRDTIEQFLARPEFQAAAAAPRAEPAGLVDEGLGERAGLPVPQRAEPAPAQAPAAPERRGVAPVEQPAGQPDAGAREQPPAVAPVAEPQVDAEEAARKREADQIAAAMKAVQERRAKPLPTFKPSEPLQPAPRKKEAAPKTEAKPEPALEKAKERLRKLDSREDHALDMQDKFMVDKLLEAGQIEQAEREMKSIERKMDANRYSTAEQLPGGRALMTADELRQEIQRDGSNRGQMARKLLASGKLKLEAQHPTRPLTAGVYNGKTATVYAAATRPGTAMSLVMHEVAGHMGMAKMLGPKAFRALADWVRNTATSKTPSQERAVAQAALKRVPSSTPEAHIDEEVVGYFIQELAELQSEGLLPKAGGLRAKWNQIKAAFLAAINRTLGTAFQMGDLTTADVSAMADAAMAREAKGKPAEGAREELRSVAQEQQSPGQQALQVVKDLNMVPEPEPSNVTKLRSALADATQNPKAASQNAKQAVSKWLDGFETAVFASDAGLQNDLRRAVQERTNDHAEMIGTLLNVSTAQAGHSEAVAGQFLVDGAAEYEADTHKWTTKKSDDNFVTLSKQLDAIATKYNLTKEQAEQIAHTAFVARRLQGLEARNAELRQRKAAGDKAAAKQKETFIHLSPDEISRGMSLFTTMPELNGLVNTWNGIRNNTAKVMVDSGLWSAEEAQDMLDAADYVPFYRDEQLENRAGPKEYISGLKVQAKEKRLKGSAAPVHDVFDNMIRWTQYAVSRAVKNRAAVALAQTATELKLGEKVSEKTGEPSWREAKKNTVRVWEDGKPAYYEMQDPLYMSAFNGLQSVAIPQLKWAASLSNFLRQSVVLNPLFSLAQVPQDSFAAMFTSGLSPRYALSIPVRAVKEFVKTLSQTSQTHNELKRYGAVGVRDVTAAIARTDAEIYAGLKAPPGFVGKVKATLQHISMASDNAVRQAVFEAAKAQGMSQAEAVEKAFQLINFRNRGTHKGLSMVAQVVPFFNAYLAAQHVALKTITGVGTSPTQRKAALQTFSAMSASVAALSLIYTMMVSGDDEYEKTRPVIRDRLLMIPGTGAGIPLRSDIFVLPKIITEHMYHLITDNGTTDGRKFRDSLQNTLMNSFLSPTVVPQAVKPLVEVGMNHNFFQGRPLIGVYEQRKEAGRQFNETTSELSKALGGAVNVSPIALDHVIRGMFGSVGGLTLWLSNTLMNSDPTGERPQPEYRDSVATLPGMSSFITKSTESAVKSDFYQLRDEVDKVQATYNDLKARSPELIPEFVANEKNLARLQLVTSVGQINRKLSEIRKAIGMISNAPASRMSGAEKEAAIKELREAEQAWLSQMPIRQMRQMAKL